MNKERRLRLLILEDSASDAELILHALRAAGFRPKWERVETEAEYRSRLDPDLDLILADYTLPQFSALAALSALKESGLPVPFIVVTGSISEEVAVECIRQGAADYLLKDRLGRLGAAVAAALEQRRLREAHRRTEAELHLHTSALEAAANAVVITDRTGAILWANPAFTRLTGYELQEVLGRNPRVLKSGEHDPEFYRHLWETILAGRVWHGEMMNRRKDGCLYVEEMTITPVPDERGEVTHFIAIKQDVTARKRMEETLRESEERFAVFMAHLPAAAFINDHEGQVLFANRYLEELFGWQEWRGKTTHELLPPAVAERMVAADVAALAQGPQTVTESIRDSRGVERIFATQKFPIHREGTPPILGGIALDVTEQEKAAEALRRYADRLRALREIDRSILAADSPVTVAQAAVHHLRRTLPCQRASVSVFDVGRQEVILLAADADGPTRLPEGARLILSEEPSVEGLTQGAVSYIPDLASEPRLSPSEQEIRADGIRALLRIPLAARGRVFGGLNLGSAVPEAFMAEHIEVAREVADQLAIALEHARLREDLARHAAELEDRVAERTAELAAANRKMAAASRAKSEFLANMSHELRTPLNGILGFAQILQEQVGAALSDKQARYLNHIYSGGQHLLQLINDILDLSKVEAGKVTLQPEPLSVAQTLEDILVIARGLAAKKEQILKSAIESNLPPLSADPIRFKQILFNLLSNAVKFTPQRGTITLNARRLRTERIADVRVRSAEARSEATLSQSAITNPHSEIGEFLELAVTDTGIGIKAEDIPKLFQEFVQLEATRDQHQEGTGLGLALTKRLVELHGGRIWVEPPGDGQGSTFTVVLPMGGP